MRPAAVYLLDADPDLADALDPATAAEALPYAVARVAQAEPGPWDAAAAHDGRPTDLGLLVLDGVILRRVEVAGRTAAELLGAGDLLRPWQREDDVLFIEPQVSWTVIAPVRYAILDRRFTMVAGRWPALMAAIVARAVRRSRSLTYHLAVSQITGVETRLLLILWELAHRWGHVRPDGVHLRLRVTHEMLAALVGARRPSVTTALATLNGEGRLTQAGPGRWILHGDPPGAGAGASRAAEAAER